jgi:hypothetical protein
MNEKEKCCDYVGRIKGDNRLQEWNQLISQPMTSCLFAQSLPLLGTAPFHYPNDTKARAKKKQQRSDIKNERVEPTTFESKEIAQGSRLPAKKIMVERHLQDWYREQSATIERV